MENQKKAFNPFASNTIRVRANPFSANPFNVKKTAPTKEEDNGLKDYMEVFGSVHDVMDEEVNDAYAIVSFDGEDEVETVCSCIMLIIDGG